MDKRKFSNILGKIIVEGSMKDSDILSAAKKLAKNGKNEKTKSFGQGLVDFYEKNKSFTPDQVAGLQNIMKKAPFQMAESNSATAAIYSVLTEKNIETDLNEWVELEEKFKDDDRAMKYLKGAMQGANDTMKKFAKEAGMTVKQIMNKVKNGDVSASKLLNAVTMGVEKESVLNAITESKEGEEMEKILSGDGKVKKGKTDTKMPGPSVEYNDEDGSDMSKTYAKKSNKETEKDLKEAKTLSSFFRSLSETKYAKASKKTDDGEGLDPVGKSDPDVNNDGEIDKEDEYLSKRRAAIAKAIKKESIDYKKTDINEAKEKGFIGKVDDNIYAVNIPNVNGGNKPKNFSWMIDNNQVIKNFKKKAKIHYVDAKGKSALASLKKAIKMLGAKYYYASTKDTRNVKNDSFELYYTTDINEETITEGSSIGIEDVRSLESVSDFETLQGNAISILQQSNTDPKKKNSLIADIKGYGTKDKVLKTMWNIYLSGERLGSLGSRYSKRMRG